MQSPNTDQSQELTPDQIKSNLQRYSPFYKQEMHFDKAEFQTLFYVAHNNFSSEKALKKLQAFGLFKDKKIIFVEFRGAKRGPVSDAGVEGDAEGVSDQPRRNSAHFTVKVKDKGIYTFRELEISADGKCGIASSMVALNEILRGDTPLSPEVLLRAATVVSGSPQDGDIVQSDPKNPFDDLLEKIYRHKILKTAEGGEEYGELTLHHCVKNNLTSESPEFQQIFGNLSPQLKERVGKLLTNTQESDWLEPKHVYEILTTNLGVIGKIRGGELQNISADNIFLFQAAIPATRIAEEPLPLSPEASSAPNAYNKTLTRAGNPNEGMELEPDKTLKHEFRIIVLNILHEWINTTDQDFSEINEDDFLESLIRKKLGDVCAQKIKVELGGEITFKSLLAIDEDLSPQVASSTTLASIPENLDPQQVERLKKEREAFYSAQCSFGAGGQGDEGNSENPSNKVWERIKDIVDKYCSTEDFQTLNTDFNTSFSGALEKISEMPETNNEGLISSTLNGFKDKIGKITEVVQPDKTAQQYSPPFPIEPDNTYSPARTQPYSPFVPDHAQPDYSCLDQVNAGFNSKITQEVLERYLPAIYSSNKQEPETYTFPPALIQTRLSERRVVGVQTNDIAANHPATAGFSFAPARAEPDSGPILVAGNSPKPAQAEPAPAHPAPAQPLAPAQPVPAGVDPAQPDVGVTVQPLAPAGDGSAPTVNWDHKLNLVKAEFAGGAPAPAQTVHAVVGPAADAPKVGTNESLDQLGELMHAALVVIGKAFEDLYEAIKKGCDDARKNLLEKVKELETNITLQEKKLGDPVINSKETETPKNNPSPTLFSVLRRCLERDNKS